MLLLLGSLSAAIWLWLLFFQGRFWLSGPTLADAPRLPAPVRVAVVVPARDEAEHAEQALRSLLAQQLDGELCVILVDDNSGDGTGDLARRIAEEDPRLRVVAGEALPPGWSGKLWAVAQGLRRPEAREADYVLLTDADIVHSPAHLRALIGKAADQLDLVSEMVRLHCETAAERAMIPAFVFFFQMLYPFAWVGDRTRRTAAAAGGTLLISRRALDAVHGVDRIRGELIDDVAMAQQVKAAGYGIWLGHAEHAVSARIYAGFGDTWSMIARTAYVQLRYSPLLLAATCVGMLLVFAGPVIAAAAGSGMARWTGLAAWLMMAAAFQPTLRRYRCSSFRGLVLPGIAMFYLAATCGSAARFCRGKGGNWKNRDYPARSETNRA